MTDRLYTNGTIRTVAGAGGIADWILTRKGRIAAVGRGAAESGDAERIDLEGRCLVPGFIDPHGHFPESGFNTLYKVDLAPPPLGSCAMLSQALGRIAEAPGTGWVLCAGFDHTAIAEGRFPTRTEIDAVQPERPVWLLHVSGHAGAANSAAMARLGLTGSGFLEGMVAMGELGATDFGIDASGFAAGVAAAAEEYLSQGVTLAQNAWIERRMLDRFIACDRAGKIPIDVVLLPRPSWSRGCRPTCPAD